jgi:hypothetical protein
MQHMPMISLITSGRPLPCPLLAGLPALLCAATATARTITLTAEDADQMAVIDARAPRLSWAAVRPDVGVFNATPQLQLYDKMAVLIHFPLDRIPRGQRILKAELTIKVEYVDQAPKLSVRRLLAEWGSGVCHLYRMTFPAKVPWGEPGGRGSADRVDKATAVFPVKAIGTFTVDVTEDIELWYTGGAANRGWILSAEGGYSAYLPSPYSPTTAGAREWKLQITYEAR